MFCTNSRQKDDFWGLGSLLQLWLVRQTKGNNFTSTKKGGFALKIKLVALQIYNQKIVSGKPNSEKMQFLKVSKS